MTTFEQDSSGLIKVKDLNQYSRGVNIIVKVVMKTEIRSVMVRTDESQHRVCEALVADDTGAVYVSLWDDHIDKIQDGMYLKIKNAYMNVFRGSMRMNIGRYGSYEVLEEIPFETVNLENNLSANMVEYEDPRRGNQSGGYGGRYGDGNYRGRRY